MHPLGKRPNHLLDHLLNPIDDGKALQFIDQPDQKIKCYNAIKGVAHEALGKAVQLYEAGNIYYVKKSDLLKALNLQDSSTTPAELNTEFIFRLIQTATGRSSPNHLYPPFCKEFLISSYYATQNELEEAARWEQSASVKGFSIPLVRNMLAPPKNSKDKYDRQFLPYLRLMADHFIEETDRALQDQPGFDEYAIGLFLSKYEPLHDYANHFLDDALKKGLFRVTLVRAAIGPSPFMKVYHLIDALKTGLTEAEPLLKQLIETNPEDAFRLLFSTSNNDDPDCPVTRFLLDLSETSLELFDCSPGKLRWLGDSNKRIARALTAKAYNVPEKRMELFGNERLHEMFTEEELTQIVSDIIQQNDSRRTIRELLKKLKKIHPHTIYVVALIMASKKYDLFTLDLLKVALKGNLRAIRAALSLAQSGKALAQVKIHELELVEFLSQCDLSTFCSTKADEAFEKYFAASTNYPLPYVTVYLLASPLREHLFFEPEPRCNLIDQFREKMDHTILLNSECKAQFQTRCLAEFETTTNIHLKAAIGKIILNNPQFYNNGVSVVREIAKTSNPPEILELFPLLLQNISQESLRSMISQEDLLKFEKEALQRSRRKTKLCISALKYLEDSLSDHFNPMYFEMYVEETHYAAIEFGEHFTNLVSLALKGDQKSIDLVSRLGAKNQQLSSRYRLFSFILSLSAEELAHPDMRSSIFGTYLDFKDLIAWHQANHVPSFFEPDVDPVQREQKLAQIVIRATQLHDWCFIPQLTELAHNGHREAFDTLKQLAQSNSSLAYSLAACEFRHFCRSCTIEMLRSNAFNQAIEDYTKHNEAGIGALAVILYVLPPHLRLAWIADLPEPLHLDQAGIYEYHEPLNDPYICAEVIRNIDECFNKELPFQLMKALAVFVTSNNHLLGIEDDHPLFMRALCLLLALDVEEYKNPVTVFQRLQALRKEPSDFTPPTMPVEGKMVGFNLRAIQSIVEGLSVPHCLLHADVTWEKWVALVQQIDVRQADPIVAEAINECTVGGWKSLKATCLDDVSFFKPRIEFKGLKVPLNFAELNAILHKIFHLDNDAYPLSPREEAFIKFAESVKNCKGGKHEGVSLFYINGLEPNDKFPIEIVDEPDLAKSKAKGVLAELYQNSVRTAFSGTNPLMQDLVGIKKDVNEAAHHSIYLKNLIAHIVGFANDLYFDINTGVVSRSLLMRSREEVLEIFFEHFTPQTLVEDLHMWMNRDSEIPGRKNWDKVFTLVVPDEEDMLWDPETDMPTVTTKQYARKVLESAGYLTSIT